MDQEIIQHRSLVLSYLNALHFPNNKECVEKDNSCYRGNQVYRIVQDLGMNPEVNFRQFLKLGVVSPELPQKQIPHILHEVWVGLPDQQGKVKTMPHTREKIILSTLSQFNQDWVIYFWTNNLDAISKTISEHANVQVREYSDAFSQYTHLFSKLSKSQYLLAPLSDLLRALVLKKYGGLYLDTDYKLCKPLDQLLSSFDFLVGQERVDRIHAASGFLAAHQDHPIISGFTEMILRNLDENTALNYVKRPCDFISWVHMSTGPSALTYAILQNAYQNNNKDGVLDAGILLDYTGPNRKLDIHSDSFCTDLPERSYGNDAYGGSWLSGSDELLKEIYPGLILG